MRTMEERKAEVMRRSNARKKAYKRRVSVIAAIVPLICIAIIGVNINLIKFPKTNGTEPMADGGECSYVCVYISAETNSDSVNIKHTDTDTVTEISSVLLDITKGDDITIYGTDVGTAIGVYTITLKDRDDNEQIYTLCGNVLTDCETALQYSLTQNQLKMLKIALGI
ncbi:MAG: hypothetical protein II306_01295 [Clostridia bacterium]|nr:hypothetical protein [Clostridia bacterium]